MDLKARIEAANNRRNALASDLAKIKGQYEAAQENLAQIESECRAKGVDPNDLDREIERLRSAIEQKVTAYEAELAQVENLVNLFKKEIA